MVNNDDLTQPISESYFVQSPDNTDLTYNNNAAEINTLREKDLADLIAKIDKNKVQETQSGAPGDSASHGRVPGPQDHQFEHPSPISSGNSSIHSRLDDDIDIFIQSTPKGKKMPQSAKATTSDELMKFLQPMLNDEFNEFKSMIKNLIEKREEKKPEGEISRSSPVQGSELELNRLNFDSPVTTPPTSKEQPQSSSKGTNQGLEEPATRLGAREFRGNGLADVATELERLRLENRLMKMENQSLKEAIEQNKQLQYKLDQSKEFNREIVNELNFLKSQRAHKGEEEHRGQEQSAKSADQPHQSQIPQAPQQSEECEPVINEHTVSPQFKQIYNDLNLQAIDGLSKQRLANILKNVLLKLVIEYDDLPQKLETLIQSYKAMTKFVNEVHVLLFAEEIVMDPALGQCLHNMLSILQQRENEPEA